jgi:DNA-binding NtrC family response regulator
VIEDVTRQDSVFEEAVGGAHALVRLREIACDNVLLDLNLPDLDSAELARLIVNRYPHIAVGFIDSQALPHAARLLEKCDSQIAVGEETTPLEQLETSRDCGFPPMEASLNGMIGASRAMQRVYVLARMVAKRDTAVLITGETGTGKELVAEAIHKLSPRCEHPFVVINCAAIPGGCLNQNYSDMRGARLRELIRLELGVFTWLRAEHYFWMRSANCL